VLVLFFLSFWYHINKEKAGNFAYKGVEFELIGKHHVAGHMTSVKFQSPFSLNPKTRQDAAIKS
jgi:hypothetical protein